MQTVLLLGGVLAHEAPIWKACATVGFPFEQLMYPQLAAGATSVSAQQAFDLVALADVARGEDVVRHYLEAGNSSLAGLRLAHGTRFLAAFERFLHKYGHRGREVLRTWHLVLAERFVERGWLVHRDDYFLLHYQEIAAVLRAEEEPASFGAIVDGRRMELERHRRMQMPLLMRASQLPALMRVAGLGGGVDESDLPGRPVSGGVVEGEVVVIRDPGDVSRMKRGAILVAPATDPSWTPLFTLASGVIVEVGGVPSHASTIAREYGLPALANVKNATRLLRTGERVRLDAIAGRVCRLQSGAPAGQRQSFLTVEMPNRSSPPHGLRSPAAEESSLCRRM